MRTWDKTWRVKGPDGTYVVRAGPEGRTPVMTPPRGALFYYLSERLLQLVRRKAWVVTVQEADAFPYGPVVWEGSCESRRVALHLARAIRDDLRVRGLGETSPDLDPHT